MVAVGPEKLLFTVHKGLVCKYSTYFHGAFGTHYWTGFVEAQQNRVDLSEETVRDFSTFIRWLYRREILLPDREDYEDIRNYEKEVTQTFGILSSAQSAEADNVVATANPGKVGGASTVARQHLEAEDESLDDEDEDEDYLYGRPILSHHQWLLVDLFAFADRRGVVDLRNEIVTFLAKNREQDWPLISADYELVENIYSSLPPSSGMRTFVVDEAVWCWSAEENDTDALDCLPPEFNAAFIKTVLEQDKDVSILKTPWRYDLCKYHNHKDELEIIACREALGPWYEAMVVKSRDESLRKHSKVDKQ